MPRLPITPGPLTPTEFNSYAQSWENLINGDTPNVAAWFASNNANLLNYVYLTKVVVDALLEGPEAGNTVSIRTKFVLMPGETPVFNLALFGIDGSGLATTGYYLAGVAAVPAQVVSIITMDEPISPSTAAAWIINWNALNDGATSIRAALFNSETPKPTNPNQLMPLCGYTFEVSDFTDCWPTNSQPTDALWLNFDLHQRPDAPIEAPLMFGAIVTHNTVPPAGDVPGTITLSSKLLYFDVAKPCPPYC